MATWARGIDFKNTGNTKRLGGVGIFGTDGAAEKVYLGLGTDPWSNQGLELTASTIKFKGTDLSLNGHSHASLTQQTGVLQFAASAAPTNLSAPTQLGYGCLSSYGILKILGNTDESSGGNGEYVHIAAARGLSPSTSQGLVVYGTYATLNGQNIVVNNDSRLTNSRPANGGNADTVDGLHADKFYQKHSTHVSNTTNWNDLTIPGCYKIQMASWGATSLNGPNNLISGLYCYGLLIVDRADADGENRTVQTYYPHNTANSNPILTRMLNGTGWNAWTKIARGLTVGDIGAAAASHNHTSLSSVTSIGGGGAGGSYGSLDITGSKGGWSGIRFTSSQNVTLMLRDSDSYFGIYRSNGTWIWSFDQNGALVNGSVDWSKITNKPTISSLGGVATSGTARAVIGNGSSTAFSNAQLEIFAPSSGNARITLHSSGSMYASLSTAGSDTLLASTERNGKFKLTNANGSWEVGALNPSHCHYQTDRPNHWFNKEVRVQGEIYAGGSYDQRVWHSGNFDPNTKAASSHNHTSLTGVSSISLNNDMIVRPNSNGGIDIAPFDGSPIKTSSKGDITGIRILGADEVSVKAISCDGAGYFKNSNATAADSGYLTFNRANGVRGAHFTSNDSGLGLRLHLYNNTGAWSTHYIFKENGVFSPVSLENRNNVITIGKEGNHQAMVQFYDGTKAYRGYVGKGSSTTNTISLVSETGDILLYANTNYAYVRGHWMPDADNTYYLGLTSPASRRWKQLIATSTSISTSDSRNKENITPIVDDISTFSIAKHNRGFNVKSPNSRQATKQDYYEFMKDRFYPYLYNYKITTQEQDESITQEDKLKCAKTIGFVADEYDLDNDNVAKEFIFRTEDGMLNYNTGSYTTVVAIALQKAIEKIEALEAIVNELRKDVK